MLLALLEFGLLLLIVGGVVWALRGRGAMSLDHPPPSHNDSEPQGLDDSPFSCPIVSSQTLLDVQKDQYQRQEDDDRLPSRRLNKPADAQYSADCVDYQL